MCVFKTDSAMIEYRNTTTLEVPALATGQGTILSTCFSFCIAQIPASDSGLTLVNLASSRKRLKIRQRESKEMLILLVCMELG